jgi:hypothetical protein
MKRKAMKILWGGLAVIGLLLVAAAIFVAVYGGFPGEIKETPFQKQVTAVGLKSTFRQGIAYRYQGLPPMLDVSGDPYEMGLQYGVLLRPEIVTALDMLRKFLKAQAGNLGVPYFAMTAVIKYKAGRMAARVPRKYIDEMRGVADGSIIHGRLNDMAGFGGISRIAAIVRYRPRGLNSFIHMDIPLYLGVETGMNDKGLCLGGETLLIKKSDGRGFSHPFLMRMILEEAGSLDEIYPYFDKYRQVGGDGVVWSDLGRGRGAVIEMTPTAWAKREFTGLILWDFNRFYDEALAAQRAPAYNVIGGNIDREAIASAFPQKASFTLEDMVAFLRNQTGPGGVDYAWNGTRLPVCNKWTTQMMIFDSKSDGFFLAMGSSFASRRNIYHVFSDFAKPPELFRPAAPINPLAEEAAEIENNGVSSETMLRSAIDFAKRHEDDANAQFFAAYKAFRCSRPDLFIQYSEKAFAKKPDEPEYRLFAGLAAYQRNDMDRALTLLEPATARYPEQEIFRLTALEQAWAAKNPQKAVEYRHLKQELLNKHGMQTYFTKKLKPLLEAPDKTVNRDKETDHD